MRPHRRQPTRLPRPWDSPGKNTGVGCHFLLQCLKMKSESEVAQSCLTLCDPIDGSPLLKSGYCSVPRPWPLLNNECRTMKVFISFVHWPLEGSILLLLRFAPTKCWAVSVGLCGAEDVQMFAVKPTTPWRTCKKQREQFYVCLRQNTKSFDRVVSLYGWEVIMTIRIEIHNFTEPRQDDLFSKYIFHVLFSWFILSPSVKLTVLSKYFISY